MTAVGTMTEHKHVRIPAHLLLMLSASTAAYAIALAGIAGVQSADEAALAAARDPVARTIDQVAAGHDDLEARIDQARAGYAAAARSYVAAGGALAALESQLGDLATVVADIDGVSRTLPSSVRLPAIGGSVAAGRAPTTHATTGASGG